MAIEVELVDGRILEFPDGTSPAVIQSTAKKATQDKYFGVSTAELKAAPSAPMSFGDTARSGIAGLTGALGSAVSAFGADTAPAQGLRSLTESIQSGMTPERLEEQRRRDELMQRSEKEGLGAQILAGAGAVTEAPIQSIAQGLGSSIPAIAAGLVAVVAGAPVAIAGAVGLAARAIFGAVQGAGEAKSDIYSSVKAKLMESGKSEAQAEAEAAKAQEYVSKNLPGIIGSSLAGAVDAATGVESIVGKGAFKSAVKPLEKPSLLRETFKQAGSEALPEGLQAGVGQVTQNVALQNAGFDTSTFEGVAGSVTRDALMGALTGGAVTPLQMSSLRRDYELDKQRKVEEENRVLEEKIAKEEQARQEQIVKTQEDLGLNREFPALPAPAEQIEEPPVAVDPLKNPLGNIQKNEIPEISQTIDEYRKNANLPPLKDYSVEDLVDAMPGTDPRGEEGLLNEWLTAKTGWTKADKMTAQQVLDQAKLKKIETKTKGFEDFLARVTGYRDLTTMSQPQLFAAFKALSALPESETTQILPEGTNASRFSEDQYRKALDGVDQLLDGLVSKDGKPIPLDRGQVIKEIQKYTGLKKTEHAESILDEAIRLGDLDSVKTPRYRMVDPATGQLKGVAYDNRKAADAAAKQRGYDVKQITAEGITPPTTAATLPEGFDIRKGSFKEGEAPEGYSVMAGDEALYQAKTSEEAVNKKASFEKTRAGMANAIDNQIAQKLNSIEQSQGRLNKMEAMGEGQTDNYAKARGKHAQLEESVAKDVEGLLEKKAKYESPISIKAFGKKAIGRTGYTVFEGGEATATYPTRTAAEEAILTARSDDELKQLTKDQGRRGLGKRAEVEIKRRAAPPPTEGKKVSEVLEGIEEEKRKPKPIPPEVKANIEKLEKELRPLMEKLGLGKVTLNVVQDIENNAEGAFSETLMRIAMDSTNPVRTMRHESIHALKELGFFTPAQWNTLQRMAKDKWIQTYLKDKNAIHKGKSMTRFDAYMDIYGGNMDTIIEEAIADAFADFDVNKAPPGLITALLNKIRAFFEALRNAMAGAGFQTADEVFGMVERGELKEGEQVGSEGQKYSLSGIGVPMSTRNLMEVQTPIAQQELGLSTDAKRGRFNNVRQIATALNQYTLDNLGEMDRNKLTQADSTKISKAIADEVAFQLGVSSKTGTGLGWYSNNYPNAVKRLANRFPELGTNQHARSVFSAIVAVTSNGEKVAKNIDNAIKLYGDLRVGKRLVAMSNRRATALENNLAVIESLLKTHGQDFEKVLLKEITVKEMNARLRELGEESDGSYLADTVVPAAAVYFGPKLGAFYANLSGSEGYLTMDLWWTRSINRMRGLLIPQATDASINKFRDMMELPSANREEVVAATIPLRNKYEEYGYNTELEHLVGKKEPAKSLEKPAWFKKAKQVAGDAYEQLFFEHNLEKMANTIYKNEFEMLEEAPFTATDRKFMYDAARKAQGLLQKEGIDLTLADIQAALWYYEKRLYEKLSGRKADDIGYEEAIIAQANQGNGRARPSVVFDQRPDGGTESAGTSREATGVREQPAGVQQKLSLRAAPESDEFKQWFGDSKIVDSKGKPVLLYHATNFSEEDKIDQENVFSVFKESDDGKLGAGIYASSLPKYAESYGPTGTVMPLYASIKNPLVINMDADGIETDADGYQSVTTKVGIRANTALEGVAKKILAKKPDFKTESKRYLRGPEIQELLEMGGYDGVVLEDNEGNFVEVNAFKPEQLKSSIGNIGTYDAANPDIRFSLKEAPDTPEFKQWFGDSKVVDKNGKPLVVYHATAKDFMYFDPKKLTKNTSHPTAKLGFFAAADPASTDEFITVPYGLRKGAYEEGANVMPLYASIKNPATIPSGQFVMQSMALRNMKKKDAEKFINDYLQSLRDEGYDGILIKADTTGRGLAGGNEFTSDNWVALDASQFKSAIGNTGAYGQRVPTAQEAKSLKMSQKKAVESQEKGDVRFSLREAPDTPAFKRFFAGSKVVNEDGSPKVMYHGTNKDFNEFLIAEKANRTGMPDGFYFTSDAEDASRYAKGDGANVMPVYLSIKNPYNLGGKNKISKEMVMQFRDELRQDNPNLPFSWIQEKVNIFKENTAAGRFPFPSISFPTAAMQRVFEAGGYDGLIDGSRVFVAFNPSQVKSATGNVGTFDKESSDVRFSLRYSLDPSIEERVNATTTSREEKGHIDRMIEAISPSTYSRFRAQALNRYDRLSEYDKMLAKQMGGVDLLADASAEAAALMSDLGAGVTASVLGVHDRNGGIPVFRKGVTTVDGSIKGPISIFVPLAKLNNPKAYRDYQFWSGVKRGRPFIGAGGKELLFKEGDIKQAELLEKEYKDMGVSFDQIQKEWIQFNNGLVKYLVDTGVLSEKQADLFTRYSDYVPFYRQMDGEKTVGPNIFQSISGVKQPKKYKGETEAPLADFLETIVRNTQSAIQMGVKNTAAQRAVGVATQIQMAEKLKYKPKSMISVVTVLEKGQEAYYDCYDPLFIESVKSLNIPDLPFIGLLSAPANLLRNLVTKDPGFMMANMLRDSLSAWVTSGAKMTPIASTIANFGKSLAGTSPEFRALLNAGILGGYEFSQNTEQSGRTLAQALRLKAGTGNLGDKASSLWDVLEKGTTASDAATRIEVYKSTLAETGNEAEALFRSLEVMNFNRKGSSAVIRVMTAAIPFLNARMQGLDVLYRAGIRPLTDKLFFGKDPTEREKEIQRIFFVRGMTITALSAMYWLLTHDDEEYKKQEQETRDNNWLFPSLGIKIPIPFEVGVIFKVIPERIMAALLGEDTSKDFTESMMRNLRSTLAIDYIPQTLKPIVEVSTNFSFFTRRPIVGQGLDGVSDQFQVGPTTSIIAEKIGKQIGMSPMKVDHLINGYTGTVGSYITLALDAIMDMNSDSPKAALRFEQTPVLKRFLLDPEAKGSVSAYYALKNSVDETVRTSNLLERTGNYEEWGPYMRDNIKMLSTKDYISDLEKSMKEFREIQVLIRSSQMNAVEKREALLNITKAQNALTANIQLLKKNVQ